MRSCQWSRVLIATVAASTLAGIGSADSAVGATAPHRVQPGALVRIAGMHCKVGLLLHHGKKVFAGVPASCAALPTDEGQHQDGCAAASAPVGTPARIAGARRHATLVYDSFTRMEDVKERNQHPCYYNDLALLMLKPADAKRARGAVPGLHSPKRVSHHGPASGSQLSSGSSTATAGTTTHGGWLYNLSAAPTVTASDVGMPYVQGTRLVGMLTQIPQGMIVKTQPGLSNLYRALAFMRKSPPAILYHHGHRHLVRLNHIKLLRAGQQA